MVDDASGLLLAREVVGPRGKVERSVRFTAIAVGGPAALVATPPHDVRTPDAEHLRSVPDGYHAPRTAAGFELVTRSRHPDGVLLFYSDGVFTMSVFEQRGDLDWDALPAGGARSSLADTRTRTYREPGVDVAVWERDGTVYTCVTDAPSDVFDRLVASFAPADRSAGDAVVDFVLGPFGWR
jgi:negative regulator of sigma E activity